MALPAELLEIAAALTVDEIPPKLRCGSCNLLAIDAFRMPCCDQIICDTCQQNLGQACPICLHEPVNAEDCKPNKALRTTVKVWLKKRSAEREAALKRELASKAPTTISIPATPSLIEPSNNQITQASAILPDGVAGGSVSEKPRSRQASEARSATGAALRLEEQHEAQKDIPQPSIEPGQNTTRDTERYDAEGGNDQEQDSKERGKLQQLGDAENQQNQQRQLYDQWVAMNGSVSGMGNGTYGFDGMSGGFPNMGLNTSADFSQMMQLMPNGMQNNIMGAFPNMMAMPSMGFDPMTMAQGMYGGYNGQGIGMNGMNAGMGFANGQGAYGGYNGQSTSWNAGQNNYNQNAYGGHANGVAGDFGSNSGYGGYNIPNHQGNFNQVHSRQFPHNDSQLGYHGQGPQNRGRGRGRGYQNAGRGRGGHSQVNPGSQANHEPFHHQLSTQVDQHGSDYQQTHNQPQQNEETQSQPENGISTTNDTENLKAADEFDIAKELLPGDAEDHVETPTDPSNAVEEVFPPNKTGETKELDAEAEPIMEVKAEDLTKPPLQAPEDPPKPSPIETFVSSEQALPESSTSLNTMAPTPTSAMLPPPSPAIPTGPAALYTPDPPQAFEYGIRGRGRGYHRGSFEYRGGSRGRGAGYLTNGHSSSLSNGQVPAAPLVAPVEPKGLGVEGAPTGPKALREGLPNTGIRGGRGFAIVGRASAAAQARSNGHARSKSPSPARSRSRSRSRSPHRSHRHRSYRHRSVDSSRSNERDEDRERHHRKSRRYADEDIADDREPKTMESSTKRSSHRYRDDDKDKESVRSSHRPHRSHRDRSRERDGDHRSSRRRSRSPETGAEEAHQINNPIPTGPKAHKRKEREEEPSHSSRKRREREEEDHYRERKRTKPDPPEATVDGDDRQRSKRSHRDEGDKSHSDKHQRSQSKANSGEMKGPQAAQPQMDAHTREREARNRERLQKELQRRQKQQQDTESKSGGSKRKDSKLSQGGRRVSYKYEDEESNEARASRVESEREASRWG